METEVSRSLCFESTAAQGHRPDRLAVRSVPFVLAPTGRTWGVDAPYSQSLRQNIDECLWHQLLPVCGHFGSTTTVPREKGRVRVRRRRQVGAYGLVTWLVDGAPLSCGWLLLRQGWV